MKDLYNENYETLLKKKKKVKTSHVHGLETNTIKISITPKVTTDSMQSSQNPNDAVGGTENQF